VQMNVFSWRSEKVTLLDNDTPVEILGLLVVDEKLDLRLLIVSS
jgi:hypothetical protein